MRRGRRRARGLRGGGRDDATDAPRATPPTDAGDVGKASRAPPRMPTEKNRQNRLKKKKEKKRKRRARRRGGGAPRLPRDRDAAGRPGGIEGFRPRGGARATPCPRTPRSSSPAAAARRSSSAARLPDAAAARRPRGVERRPPDFAARIRRRCRTCATPTLHRVDVRRRGPRGAGAARRALAEFRLAFVIEEVTGRRRRRHRPKHATTRTYARVDGAPGDPGLNRGHSDLVTDDSVFTLGGDMTVVCTSTADKKCLDRWLRANAACKGVWEAGTFRQSAPGPSKHHNHPSDKTSTGTASATVGEAARRRPVVLRNRETSSTRSIDDRRFLALRLQIRRGHLDAKEQLLLIARRLFRRTSRGAIRRTTPRPTGCRSSSGPSA